MIDKNAIKDRVLTENTAQGILKHLQVLESNRERMQGRWIWELLQNARDASVDDDTHLVASVAVADGDVLFEHNGCGFTIEEVAHLIYHGSTKIEDDNTIGRYGSGFLTTHLLSPDIEISGQLQDRTSFHFLLKREISSAKALGHSMDQAWNDFDSSVAATSDTLTTRFRYPIDESARGAIEEGIATLKRCAPLVVVFNHQFRRIDIKDDESNMTFEVIERSPLHEERLQMVSVGVGSHGIQREHRFLLAEGTDVSVAAPMEPTDDGVCVPLDHTPRLFLGFPLIGTETFSFPAVINSLAFIPTENRDGIYLGQSGNDSNRTNQKLIKQACTLHVKLMEYIAKNRWTSVHELAYIPSIEDQPWLNSGWLHKRLNRLITKIRETPVVHHGQRSMKPKDSFLPLAKETVGVETLWNLMNATTSLQKGLPERNEAMGWCKAAKSWEPFMDSETTSLEECYDGSKLASYIEDAAHRSDDAYGSIDDIQSALREGVAAVEWLNQVYTFLLDEGLDGIIRETKIILSQAGYLDELANLYRDDDIDGELKDIGDTVLDLKIKERIRDSRLSSLVGEIGKGDLGNHGVAQEIARKLRDLVKNDEVVQELTQAAPHFLAWIVANEQWEYLTKFPAFSVSPPDGSSTVLWLGQKKTDDAEMPLAPIEVWAEDLQQYSDLFPGQFIMAANFFAAMPEDDVWKALNRQGYMRTDVLFESNRTIRDFLPDEPMAEDHHITSNAVPVTEISFLTRDRVGVMARVRDSQSRARLFWRFLTEWLIVRDQKGLMPTSTDCDCGDKHQYYPASWLVPVSKNSWVPQGKDIRDRPTAESLAKLLRGSGWTPDLLAEEALELLRAIRVTSLDLTRYFTVSDDKSRLALDDTITKIITSTDGNLNHLNHLREFAEDMKTDEHLPEYISERREHRRVVAENRRLGGLVEDLVRKGLEEEGFTVRETGIGSDFEIEYDVIEGEEEIGIELSRSDKTWLVEVKATREQSARMTAKQAETAVTEGNRFLLCVVPVGRVGKNLEKDDVLAKMRFVENIGPRLEPLCVDLDALNELRSDATAASDSDIHLEIEAGRARIRVEDAAWQDGICLGDLAAHLTQN